MSMQCPVRSVMVNKYYANHTLVIFIAVKYYKKLFWGLPWWFSG